MRHHYDELDVNHKLVWNFRDIGHTMRHISEGKGGQKRILILVREAGAITQRELTERLGIQPGSASEVIGKLEAAGLLERTLSQSDHRTTDIRLTQEGRVQAEEAYARREARHQQMFACLSDGEKETLLGLLERINASWEELYRGEEQDCRCGHREHRKGARSCGRG